MFHALLPVSRVQLTNNHADHGNGLEEYKKFKLCSCGDSLISQFEGYCLPTIPSDVRT